METPNNPKHLNELCLIYSKENLFIMNSNKITSKKVQI